MRCVLGPCSPGYPPPPPESLVLSPSGLPAVVVASRGSGVRTILMRVVSHRADAVRFGSLLPRIPPPPPESLVLSPSGLRAVVVASRGSGVRTTLMRVVSHCADAVRFGSLLPRIPPPPRPESLVLSLLIFIVDM